MAKLYFKYGSMGSSKTAQALITKFNYEERNMKVLLVKPSVDTRVGGTTVSSRIGLSAEAQLLSPHGSVKQLLEKVGGAQVISVDEAQFLSEEQVDELGEIAMFDDIPVLCFGLATDFATHLFPGSKRLFEIAESISEIKSVCSCGAKATVNARLDDHGNVVYTGAQFYLGGNDRYLPMCRKCWLNRIKRQEELDNE